MATRQTKNSTLDLVDPMLVQPFRIAKRVRETADTFSLELTPPRGFGDFSFLPGQFNMLYVFGVGEVPISISGNNAEKQKLIHTTRAVGAVTSAMSRLKIGDSLGVRGPYGVGWPVTEAVGHDVVVVAGGIGLAPLRPVIYHLLEHRAEYGRVILLYGSRTPEDILYPKELERWRARFDFEAHLTVDRATGKWHGNVGVVTELIHRSPFDPQHSLAMICGPEIMMRFTILELVKRGVSEDRIYVSMERNMKCGVGLCGHCQFGPTFVCKDGPVYRFDTIKNLFTRREL
ncbi:MAG: FAD/NAD(P)-binding protein [bacterium]